MIYIPKIEWLYVNGVRGSCLRFLRHFVRENKKFTKGKINEKWATHMNRIRIIQVYAVYAGMTGKSISLTFCALASTIFSVYKSSVKHFVMSRHEFKIYWHGQNEVKNVFFSLILDVFNNLTTRFVCQKNVFFLKM